MSSQMKFIVIAREDRKEDNSLGRYTLATRRVFYSEEAALAYADSLGQSRDAVAIPGRFDELRFYDDLVDAVNSDNPTRLR